MGTAKINIVIVALVSSDKSRILNRLMPGVIKEVQIAGHYSVEIAMNSNVCCVAYDTDSMKKRHR